MGSNNSKLKKNKIKSKKQQIKRILFMPTNGSGLGHLTRTLAIAKRLRDMLPEAEIIFFTTTFALHIIQQEGFFAYYLPSVNICPPSITDKDMDKMIEEQLIAIIKRHDIDTLIFDGVFPYSCMLNAVEKASGLNMIWIQRGMHKSGKSKKMIEREIYFNRIIVPGEANRDSGLLEKDNKFYYCPPIIFAEKSELLSRETVLKMWNLDTSKKTVYVQLGEGLTYDVNSLITKVINVLKGRKDLQIVVGISIIAYKKYNIDPDIFIIKDYPNSIYFNAFDFAVVTGSYNTFHETVYFSVPSILFPTKETGTDDQVARAQIASELGTGFVFTEFDKIRFQDAVLEILNPKINRQMRNNAKNIFKNGAELAAKYIMESF